MAAGFIFKHSGTNGVCLLNGEAAVRVPSEELQRQDSCKMRTKGTSPRSVAWFVKKELV